MSNDTRFWIWRAVTAFLVFIDVSILLAAIGETLKPHGHVTAWAVLFFVSVAATIYVGFLYTAAGNKRWESTHVPYDDVEALSEFAKQQAKEKLSKQPHTK